MTEWMNEWTSPNKKRGSSFNRRVNGQDRCTWSFFEQHKNPYGFKMDKSLLYTKTDILKKCLCLYLLKAQNSRCTVLNYFYMSGPDLFLLITGSVHPPKRWRQWRYFTMSSAKHTCFQWSGLSGNAPQRLRKGFIKYPGLWQEDENWN